MAVMLSPDIDPLLLNEIFKAIGGKGERDKSLFFRLCLFGLVPVRLYRY